MPRTLPYAITFIIASLVFTRVAQAQFVNGEAGTFIDTIPFAPAESFFLTKLDSLQAEILDTLHKPNGLVIRARGEIGFGEQRRHCF